MYNYKEENYVIQPINTRAVKAEFKRVTSKSSIS
jgi:hypothetical protein